MHLRRGEVAEEILKNRGGASAREGSLAVCPTGVSMRRARVVVPPHFYFFALRGRAGQPGPRAGKRRVGRDGDFLNLVTLGNI
jgi:hypothetical protein